MTWQTDSLPPQRPGSACPKPAPRAPSEQGGPGPAGLPPPRVRMRGAALPPSDTAGPCGVERRGVREGEQLANTTPYNLGLLPRGVGAGRGAPPQHGTQPFSHRCASGLSDGERADAIGHNPAATRGGEKQPPRHRKRRGGGEGRKENHSPKQANCSLPRGLGLLESQHPGDGTSGSRSIPWAAPGTSLGDVAPQGDEQSPHGVCRPPTAPLSHPGAVPWAWLASVPPAPRTPACPAAPSPAPRTLALLPPTPAP